jgi:ATP-binding cassette, subfamily B, bacterial HlyB/CyaB
MSRLPARFLPVRSPALPEGAVSRADWLWLMDAIHQLHQRVFEPAAALRASPPPFPCRLLPDACEPLGLTLRFIAFGRKGFAGLTFPVVGFLKRDSGDADEPDRPAGPNADGDPDNARGPTLPPDMAREESVASLPEALHDSAPRGVGGTDGSAREPSGQGHSAQEIPLHGIPLQEPSTREVPLTQGPLVDSHGVCPVLIIRGNADRVLFFRPGCATPEVSPASDLLDRLEPAGFLVRPREGAGDAGADFEEIPRPFGYRWFVPEIVRYRRLWIEVLVASCMIQLAGLAVPLVTQLVLDKVVTQRASATLTAAAVALALFAVFSVTMSWTRQYLVSHTGTRIDAVLGAQVFGRLLRLPLAWFEARTTGTIAARLHGIETIREFLCGAAVTLLLDLPFVVIFLAVMFWYSWQLSMLALGVLIAIVLMSLVVAPMLRQRADRHFLAAAQTQAVVTEHVAGVATIKVLQAEARVVRRFEDAFASSLQTGFETRQLSNTFGAVVSALEHVMTIGVLVVGATLVMEHPGFTVGMLVAFQMFASRLSQPVLRLAGLWQEAQQAAVAVRRLRDLMDCPTEPYSHEVRRDRTTTASVVVTDLGFRYGTHRPWLFRRLSFCLAPGNLVVVTGPSGCGKSTLAGLLLGFRRAEEGAILVDGKDTRVLSANELRACFGIVPQDPVLFSGSVLDNLMHADPGATFEDVVEACRAAEIHEVVEALPEGYRTRIGERGTGLSGGQKQRLAIAQALLKRAPVLVFDEATSALDRETAAQLARTINRLKPHVAVLFIAHQVPPGLDVTSTIRLDRAGDPT